MNSDLSTSGDYAWAAANDANRRIDSLAQRVAQLEEDLKATINAVDFMADKLGISP